MKPFEISRVCDAPRDKVWKAWTEAEHLKHWWGPKGFTVSYCKVDLRPGGIMHYCLRMPDGNEMWGKFAYREIVKPERLVWINSFSDKEGGTTVHPMSPDWPREMLTKVTFEEQGGKTLVVLTELYPSKEALDAAIASGSTSGDMNETFEQLEELVGTLK